MEAMSPCMADETMCLEPSCLVSGSAAIFIIGIVPSSSQLFRLGHARRYSYTSVVMAGCMLGCTLGGSVMFAQLTIVAASATPVGACSVARKGPVLKEKDSGNASERQCPYLQPLAEGFHDRRGELSAGAVRWVADLRGFGGNPR